MKHFPSTSLIITTYNWPEALELCLVSLLSQTNMPKEVIIADDGSGKSTETLITTYRRKFQIPLIHCWHEDNGFTRTIILNKAIKLATSDYIIQIDGDIILHPRFIYDHLNYARHNAFITGSRSLISKDKSAEILKKKSAKIHFYTPGLDHWYNGLRQTWLMPIFSSLKLSVNNLRGCNISFWKKDFERVNGYNEEITGWGREDSELAVRFINNNIGNYKIKGGIIQYHLYHQEANRNKLTINSKLLEKTIKEKHIYCINGLRKLKSQEDEQQFRQQRFDKISATIIAYNEEKKIRKCITSLKNVADEIIVIDGFSTDNTPAICKELNVTFIQNKFEGHIQQKQFAISKANYNYILSLDADEQLSEDLQTSILKSKFNLCYHGYFMNRRNFFKGKSIDHSGWYPDTRIRLFDKNMAKWGGQNPHDIVVLNENGCHAHLKGDLLHYTLESIEQYQRQTEKYARIAADFKFKNRLHRKTVLVRMIFNPISKFISIYLLRLGFLDGKYGLLIASQEFFGTFKKYKYLFNLYRKSQ